MSTKTCGRCVHIEMACSGLFFCKRGASVLKKARAIIPPCTMLYTFDIAVDENSNATNCPMFKAKGAGK